MTYPPGTKLCRLRFLQPDGTTAFSVDNTPGNPRSAALIAAGSISENWQNGRRRSASVTLDNITGDYDYNVNHIWFGTEIALDEALADENGNAAWVRQGVFLVETPEEVLESGKRTMTLPLVDKVARLDGALGGNLNGTYVVPVDSQIFDAMRTLLRLPTGNGGVLDRVAPVFTTYYDGKTQALPDSSTVFLLNAPYELRVEVGGTYWDVLSGLAAMLNAWIGYDTAGALRIDASQDDIEDADKQVSCVFTASDARLIRSAYSIQNTEVFNDYIVIGETVDGGMAAGRAQNLDAASPTNIQTIGRKTKVETGNLYTDTMCTDKAVWMLKRAAALRSAVTFTCSQILDVEGNTVCEVRRSDKPGAPVERHLIQSFSRPLIGTGNMTITATSVEDFPIATVTSYGGGTD